MASAPLDSRRTIELIYTEIERCRQRFELKPNNELEDREKFTEELFKLATTEFGSQLLLGDLVKKLRGSPGKETVDLHHPQRLVGIKKNKKNG